MVTKPTNYHVGGIGIILRCLEKKAAITLLDSYSSDELLETIEKFPITFVSLVPAQLKLLAKNKAILEKLKTVMTSGASISAEFLEAFSDINIKTAYGLTEFCSAIAISDHDLAWLKVLPNTNLKILLNDNEVAAGVVGEICIRGASQFDRYLNSDLQLTSQGYFRTGDLGVFNENKQLKILGRSDRVIISGGENINPEYIENILAAYPGLNSVAILAIDHELWGQRPVVIVEKNLEFDSNLFTDFIKNNLSKLYQPDKIVFLEKIPRTTIGKIDYQKLKQSINLLQGKS